MEMPNGEGLYLTIDRVVERECDDCDEKGYYSCPEVCPYPSCWHPEYTCRSDCDEGMLKVWVRGHVEVIYKGGSLITPRWMNGRPIFYGSANDIRKAVIAAHFAKTLPDGVAHITEEDPD